MLKVFNFYNEHDDLEDILKDIYDKEFFDFLENMVEFSISNGFKYFVPVLKVYNAVFAIDNDDPLVELYYSYKNAFFRLFELIGTKLGKDTTRHLIVLLANVGYSDKDVMHELIDRGYFFKLTEMLKSQSDNVSDVMYALGRMYDLADQDHSLKVFNRDPEFVHVLFTAMRSDMVPEDSRVAFCIVNFLLSANEDNQPFVDEIKSSETYRVLVEENALKNNGQHIQTIESEI